MEKELLKKWIMFANADLDAAKRLFKSPKPNQWTYLLILWYCHRTVEKMLKMVIINKGKEFLKIHDLLRLRKKAEIDEFPKEYENFLYNLTVNYKMFSFCHCEEFPDVIVGERRSNPVSQTEIATQW